MKRPKKLEDVMGMDLARFRLVRAYFLELDHTLMGFFPAIIRKNEINEINEMMVVCLDRALLKKVWDLLPKRRAKIGEVILLVNTDRNFGFDIQNENKEKTEPVHILTEREFKRLLKGDDDPFKWAPGLMSLREDDDSLKSPFDE